ncbi:hypothetical protein SAMD00023353_12200080 [Rosellinia necatrix]|uniref:Solute carrier family 40 member n=1 Tax=Rosellinia necatrix TaxID=77044 RepID=A0A1W2TXJ0_ROSNE|nr:hypothetical protein SAMD00023353_12200080 [Rosellinia necatrix]
MEVANPTSTPLEMNTTNAGATGFVSESTVANAVQRHLELRLYLSHFLSTWNSRAFEFAATLFLAAVYPNTLLQVSVYALVRSAAAIVFSRALGLLIDRGDRLAVVRLSIVGRGLAVAASSGIFWALLTVVGSGKVRTPLFALAIILAAVEKISSVANLVAVERDWVVVITEGNAANRQSLNARMRRIDLICKLLGPLAISSIAIASTLVAIYVTLAMSILSVPIEYICISNVFHAYPALRRRQEAATEREATEQVTTQPVERKSLLGWVTATATNIFPVSSLAFYFRHSVFAPSFALSLLYLTVLSFSGQMITYLLAVGYTSLYIGIARTVSTVFEVSATWIAPRLIRRLGPVRAGLWGINWQITWVAGGLVWFFAGLHGVGPDAVTSNPIFAATGLAAAVALSRVGLWVYDLSAQNIIQDSIEPEFRGSFSTTEAAFQNLFELLSYATTIIFPRANQFRWPVLISVVTVYAAGIIYSSFVRKNRGHLVHLPCLAQKY